jgi:hypothetical protein
MVLPIILGVMAANYCIAHGVTGLVALHAAHVGISAGMAHVAGGVLGKATIAGAAAL